LSFRAISQFLGSSEESVAGLTQFCLLLPIDPTFRFEKKNESPRRAVEYEGKEFDPIHQAQMLTYLKLSGIQTGLMFN